MAKIKKYLDKHKTLYQFIFFNIVSFIATIVLLSSRLFLDLCFAPIDTIVDIWPFGTQALGSLLAFLISNTLSKLLSYIGNRKKTFTANNNLAISVIIYIAVVLLLTLLETIIGTPIQNWLYELFGGTYTGIELTTASVVDRQLYQVCGTLSPLIYGIGDMAIMFVLDKFVIMTKRTKEPNQIELDSNNVSVKIASTENKK